MLVSNKPNLKLIKMTNKLKKTKKKSRFPSLDFLLERRLLRLVYSRPKMCPENSNLNTYTITNFEKHHIPI